MDKLRERLQKEIDEVAAKLRQVGIMPGDDEQAPRPDSQSVNDIGDVAQVSEVRDFEFGTRARLAERLNRLATAMERFDDGSYGVCERCSRRIQPARLSAIPEATFCRDCQEVIEQLERSGRYEGFAEEEVGAAPRSGRSSRGR